MVLLLIIIQPVSVETLNFYFCIYSRPLFHLVADLANPLPLRTKLNNGPLIHLAFEIN